MCLFITKLIKFICQTHTFDKLPKVFNPIPLSPQTPNHLISCYSLNPLNHINGFFCALSLSLNPSPHHFLGIDFIKQSDK